MNLIYRVLQLALFALPAALFIGLLHSAKLSRSNWVRIMTSLKRWRDIIAYALIADFVLLTAYFVLTKPESPGKDCSKEANSSFVKTLAELRTYLNNTLGNWFDWTLIGLALIAIVYFLRYIRVWRFDPQIATYFKYPPLTVSLWLAPLFAHILLNVINTPKSLTWAKELLGTEEMVYLAGFFAGCLVIPSLLRLIFSTSEKTTRETQSSQDWSDEDLLNWIKEEKPCEKDEILFDQEHEVQRLLNLFKNVNSQEARGKRIAVEGPRGIGKSTIAKRLERELSKSETPEIPGKWVMVTVDAWGRDQSSIEEQVLGLVIEKLSEYTDTFSLRNIPRVYSDAIKSLEGPLRLLDAFAPEYDTEELLTRLHNIFDLLSLNLLLVIEDPDRNYNAQTLNQLTSLIDRFKPSDHFRFNTLINYSLNELIQQTYNKSEGGHKKAEDKITEIESLNRVCEHKINLIPIDCTNTLNAFINIWEKRINQHRAIIPYEADYPLKQIALHKIQTPRDFKAIMRHADRLWQPEIFLGEIHLNDLLAVCCLSRLDPTYLRELIHLIDQKSTNARINRESVVTNDGLASINVSLGINISKTQEDLITKIQEHVNNNYNHRYFQYYEIKYSAPQSMGFPLQKIFFGPEIGLLPERKRLECIIKESPTPNKHIPTDQSQLLELSEYLSKHQNHNYSEAKKYIVTLLQNGYRVRFFSLYVHDQILDQPAIDEAKFNTIAIEAILELPPNKINWQNFFEYTSFITKKSQKAFLIAIVELIEQNSSVKASRLLAARIIAQHSANESEERAIAEKIWDSLIAALKSPTRLKDCLTQFKQMFEQCSEHSLAFNSMGSLIHNTNDLYNPQMPKEGILTLLELVFTENVESNKDIYKSLYEHIKGYANDKFPDSNHELIRTIEKRIEMQPQ